MRYLLPLLLLSNLACFLLFAFDKKRSRDGRWRIPERTLHAATLLMAAPGAWMGIFILRHKTRKASFLAVTVLITLLQAVALWLFCRQLHFV